MLPQAVQAHPVTYEDGIAFMSWNSPMMSDHWLMYSATSWLALTARGLRMDDREFLAPQLNLLVKRWNERESQANVYVMAGFGAEDVGSRWDSAALAALEADWESRRLYVAGKYQLIRLSGAGPLDYARLRLGYAPYLSAFDELATWFMVEAERQRESIRGVELTPLLRFYYRNVLWEVGASLRGNWKLNFMVHF